MAKGDTYLLVNDETGYVVAKLVLTDGYPTGDCYVYYSWERDGTPRDSHYFASVYCKPDSCTRW